MAVKKSSSPALTRESLVNLRKDPGRVFYRPAVDEVLKRGDLVEIQALIKGARDVKAKFGSLDGLIGTLEAAVKKAK